MSVNKTCGRCKQKMVRTSRKPTNAECRNPKCALLPDRKGPGATPFATAKKKP
jgi:hypothetical protein